jgi:hypothetical protein
MCERFNRNRAEFTKLIYKKKKFEKRQIIDEFSKKQKGDIIIDGSQTIGAFLEELTEYGALRYEGGAYHVSV